ncbi:MAG: LPP20 family lipoprotein [Fidelibacterota bacterium]
MKHSIFIIIFSLFLIPAGMQGQVMYPEWFVYPGKYPEVIAGFARQGSSTLADAETTLCAYQTCIAFGTLYRYQDLDQVDSDYYYNFSPDALKKIKGRLNPVKGTLTAINLITKDYIEAFSLKENVKISSEYIDYKTLPRPSWVDKYPMYSDSRHYYGIGEYTCRYNKIDAWKKSEENAIFNIMTTLAVDFHSVMIEAKSESYDTMEKVQAMKVKYLLRNIQVMERWMDTEKNLVYVLVRIPRQDVISPMLNK